MNRTSFLSFFFILIGLALTPIRADEDVRSAEALLAEGFRPVPHASPRLNIRNKTAPPSPYDTHSLPWPVAFASDAHTLGNVMAQFQPFDEPPYFHGGIDIRTTTHAPVRTPVSGWLEAGHYSYSTNPDGSMQKYWKPWPEEGHPLYFEVAVVDEHGIRFEQHHMDRERLPQAIVKKLDQGRAWVEAGTVLGYAVRFSSTYDHIHYNAILPDGTRLNPEYLSPLVEDSRPPLVLAVAAVLDDGSTADLEAPLPAPRVREFVVATYDALDKGPYQHPPTLSRLVFDSGAETVWDFTVTLTNAQGAFPHMEEVFLRALRFPDGQRRATTGGYGTGTSLIRLKVPAGARGPFRIELRDAAGNQTQLAGAL